MKNVLKKLTILCLMSLMALLAYSQAPTSGSFNVKLIDIARCNSSWQRIGSDTCKEMGQIFTVEFTNYGIRVIYPSGGTSDFKYSGTNGNMYIYTRDESDWASTSTKEVRIKNDFSRINVFWKSYFPAIYQSVYLVEVFTSNLQEDPKDNMF